MVIVPFGYAALHDRVYLARGRARNSGPCSNAGAEHAGQFEWSMVHGLTGEDPWVDYVLLCSKCHHAYDRIPHERFDYQAVPGNLGRHFTPEHRARISAGRTGIPVTAEARANMSAAAIRRHRKEKP